MKKGRNTFFVEKHDIENDSISELPIRKGCGAGVCGCMGTCRQIVGVIDRSEYEKYKSIPDFLAEKIKV